MLLHFSFNLMLSLLTFAIATTFSPSFVLSVLICLEATLHSHPTAFTSLYLPPSLDPTALSHFSTGKSPEFCSGTRSCSSSVWVTLVRGRHATGSWPTTLEDFGVCTCVCAFVCVLACVWVHACVYNNKSPAACQPQGSSCSGPQIRGLHCTGCP